jgi:DNA-binding NarL/FixJ family response regulator
MPVLRVGVLSRHPLIRGGLERLLEESPLEHEVLELTPDGGQPGWQPDVVLFDLEGLTSGPATDLAQLTRCHPVVGLELPARPDLTEDALAAGVVGVVPRAVTSAQLAAALKRAASGHVLTAAAHRIAVHADVHERYGLTQREAGVLALIASGMTNQEIADQLYLSINSVKTYIRAAYGRIGVTSRSEAVLWATRHALSGSTQRVPDRPDG